MAHRTHLCNVENEIEETLTLLISKVINDNTLLSKYQKQTITAA